MRRPYRTSLLATIIMTTLALTPVGATAHTGHQHTVRSGQSIQDALDRARPGDTIVVLAGLYRENLEIVKDNITLRGKGARLDPPAVSTPRRCSQNFGLDDNPYGICASGVRDPQTGAVTTPVTGTTIEGFTIGRFAESGIISFGSVNTVVRDNDVAGGPGDSGYSVLMLRTSGSTVVRNRVHDAGGAGIYIGSSPDAKAYVAHNISYHSGSLGYMFRDSVGGVVERNLSFDNCMGMGFVDGLSAGTAKTWTARENVIMHNNGVCLGEPELSGVGIVLAGAEAITIERNVVLNNIPASTLIPYGGGIVFTSGAVFGGTGLATGNIVRRNTILGNSPVDLNLTTDAGPGNQATGNVCRTSAPAELC